MPKIKLGQRPQNFKRVVKFKMVDGTDASIEVSFKYRTRKEFGAFIDEISAAAKVERPAGDDFSVADLWEKIGSGNADYILQAVDGWNLDEEFTRENVQQLADEIPAAVIAIIDSYREAITQGRLGN
jgi:hypothetical protein